MKVAAITTAYFPDEETILSNYRNVIDDVFVFIVVNNSRDKTLSSLTGVENLVILESDNRGVAAAVNLGARYARECMADALVLFDQDSVAEKGLIKKLKQATNTSLGTAVAAPNVIDRYSKQEVHAAFYARGERLDNRYICVDRTQTSGLFIPMKIFEEVGQFNENYFLNLVDTEWCLKLSVKGYHILIDDEAILLHSFGEGEANILGHKFRFGVPFRMYYTARDSLYLLTESRADYAFKMRLATKLIVSFFEVFVLDNKAARWKYLFKGIADYFSGVRGRALL